MSILWEAGPVFWLIVVLGIGAVIVFFERLLHLRRAQIDSDDFMKGVCNVLDNGNVDEAIAICEETPGPVAAVTLTAIRCRDGSLKAMSDAVNNRGRAEIARLERRLASIAITCQIAPLLGLIGTLFGVIEIVQALNNQAPVIQSTDLTTGLMHALVAVVAGLLVAAPCHVMHSLLMLRIERITIDMESAAAEIVAFFTKKYTSMF